VVKNEEPLRVVLDTNVILSALLFRSGVLTQLRELWQSGKLHPVVSTPVVQELLRVLSYPKFRLTAKDTEELLADYLPYAEVMDVDPHANALAHLPPCRDAYDQMFLEIAQVAQVDYLVTGDADLLVLHDPNKTHLTFSICTPRDLLDHFAH
jgi:uncharacterized protein